MTFASRRTPGWNSWSATCAPVASISWKREAFARPAGARRGDFGVVVMVRVFVGLVIRWRVPAPAASGPVADDPIFQRFGNVRVVPTARTLSRWLRHFNDADGCDPLPSPQRGRRAPAAATRWRLVAPRTVDVDGVVVSTGLQVERAARGYNLAPAEGGCPATTRSWRTWPRRPTSCGSRIGRATVHDGKAGLPFLRALWPQLVGLRTGGARLRFRMDGAFFRQDVLRWLQGRGVGYAINVPFYRWLDLQRYIRDSPIVLGGPVVDLLPIDGHGHGDVPGRLRARARRSRSRRAPPAPRWDCPV